MYAAHPRSASAHSVHARRSGAIVLWNHVWNHARENTTAVRARQSSSLAYTTIGSVADSPLSVTTSESRKRW